MSFLGTQRRNDDDEDEIDVLDGVKLTSFTASPAAIQPFGSATVRWSVSGPPGFSVRLNYSEVAKSGQWIVQPTSTTSYRLSAYKGQATKHLGSVQVSVDSATCETYRINNPKSAIEAPIRAGINASEDLSFTGANSLVVSFSPQRIHIRMRLKKDINNFPDPTVTIDASFRMFVRDGALATYNEQVSVAISVPSYAWLIPGAIPGLAIAIDMAREDAVKQMLETIEGLAQLLNLYALPPQGKRLNAVRIDAGDNGGIIELTACAPTLLVRMTELSGVVGPE